MRFFVDLNLYVGRQYPIPEQVAHHWLTVLRGQLGDEVTWFNGKGGEYQVKLIQATKRQGIAEVIKYVADDRASSIQVALGQVMSRGDRLDYVIQKSTELGVHTIQLLTSERCEMRLRYERDQKKLDHWQAVAIAACEQCGLNRIPEILAPISLATWLSQVQATAKLVLAPHSGTSNVPTTWPNSVAILVGPEGGLTEQEILLAKSHNFQPWQLGPRILRTETAPVVALALIQAQTW